MKKFVAEPRYAWGGETHHNVGTISEIEGDGLLMIQIPNRPIPWQSNPVDMEKVESFKVISYHVVLLLILSNFDCVIFAWSMDTRCQV